MKFSTGYFGSAKDPESKTEAQAASAATLEDAPATKTTPSEEEKKEPPAKPQPLVATAAANVNPVYKKKWGAKK